MASYDKVKTGKLTFKGGLAPPSKIDKKKKKKKQQHTKNIAQAVDASVSIDNVADQETYEIDPGTGHAPLGSKKSKYYEELFPVETKRFGYETTQGESREAVLDARAKKKADRYCK